MCKRELLQKPLKNLEGNVQSTFEKIAENLFSNFCIKCGETVFYFAEVEFYYYDSRMYMQNNEHHKWQKVAYARTDKKVGDFYYHLSGIDICFDSDIKDGSAIFGGILIRSIKDKTGKIVAAGPYTCRDFILNECLKSGMSMPELQKRNFIKFVPKPTKRSLGKNDMEQNIDNELLLCFYDDGLDWKKTSERDVYDKEKGTTKSKTKDYSSRFK